ncbi:hypothetical protein [Kordiimonas aestuarii]|uniref:hypothetical protein n=1 Tax=Kordiimonas aestuarii TaxID=1005925 RepID=UPI0021CE0394|nr:hypothetical protein [Kordiimonas aestuarii]
MTWYKVEEKGCPPVDFWLDTKTHRLERITSKDGDTAFTGDVKRHQSVEDALVPNEMTQTMGGAVMLYTLTPYEFIAVPVLKILIAQK